MPTWPATLPRNALLAALSIRSEPNLREFRPDVGGPIRQRRYTATRTIYSGDLMLKGVQIETLRAFFHVDCADGSLSFEMDDWWAMAFGPPATATFRFDQPPDYARVSGQHWRVSLVISKID